MAKGFRKPRKTKAGNVSIIKTFGLAQIKVINNDASGLNWLPNSSSDQTNNSSILKESAKINYSNNIVEGKRVKNISLFNTFDSEGEDAFKENKRLKKPSVKTSKNTTKSKKKTTKFKSMFSSNNLYGGKKSNNKSILLINRKRMFDSLGKSQISLHGSVIKQGPEVVPESSNLVSVDNKVHSTPFAIKKDSGIANLPEPIHISPVNDVSSDNANSKIESPSNNFSIQPSSPDLQYNSNLQLFQNKSNSCTFSTTSLSSSVLNHGPEVIPPELIHFENPQKRRRCVDIVKGTIHSTPAVIRVNGRREEKLLACTEQLHMSESLRDLAGNTLNVPHSFNEDNVVKDKGCTEEIMSTQSLNFEDVCESPAESKPIEIVDDKSNEILKSQLKPKNNFIVQPAKASNVVGVETKQKRQPQIKRKRLKPSVNCKSVSKVPFWKGNMSAMQRRTKHLINNQSIASRIIQGHKLPKIDLDRSSDIYNPNSNASTASAVIKLDRLEVHGKKQFSIKDFFSASSKKETKREIENTTQGAASRCAVQLNKNDIIHVMDVNNSPKITTRHESKYFMKNKVTEIDSFNKGENEVVRKRKTQNNNQRKRFVIFTSESEDSSDQFLSPRKSILLDSSSETSSLKPSLHNLRKCRKRKQKRNQNLSCGKNEVFETESSESDIPILHQTTTSLQKLQSETPTSHKNQISSSSDSEDSMKLISLERKNQIIENDDEVTIPSVKTNHRRLRKLRPRKARRSELQNRSQKFSLDILETNSSENESVFNSSSLPQTPLQNKLLSTVHKSARSPCSNLFSPSIYIDESQEELIQFKRHRSKLSSSVRVNLVDVFSETNVFQKSLLKECYVSLERLNMNNLSSTVSQHEESVNIIERSVSLFTSRRASVLCQERVLEECDCEQIVSFSELINDENILSCSKLGEGVYGEVFKCEFTNEPFPLALKIVPVNGKLIVNNERQKTFQEVFPEVICSRELSRLRENHENSTDGFIQLHKMFCVVGSFPEILLSAWDEFDDKRRSENDRPHIFANDQHYLVFAYIVGGEDVENYSFYHAAQALSVVQQVALSLAVGEQALQFEHRDLHWGNVLVCKTQESEISAVLNGEKITVKSYGVKAYIIDFTLSRLTKGKFTLYQNLALDPDLFTMDSSEDYQFEIYKMMKKATLDEWHIFVPATNVYWLHYLTDKFLSKIKYIKAKTKLHRQKRALLKRLNHCVLEYDSCVSFVNDCL